MKTNDVNLLIKKLMMSTTKYVVGNLSRERHIDLYRKIMKILHPTQGEELESLISKINRQMALSKLLYEDDLSNWFTKDSHYHALACSHALDIVLSIKKRFVDNKLNSDFIYNQEDPYENQSLLGRI